VDIRDIIACKRDGAELTPDEISWVVGGYTQGLIPDAPMAALLMAIVLRGMTARETTDLTLAMLDSGDRLDLSSLPGATVDKHSTGGVGDKTTLVVAPLLATLGVKVGKVSGRALGHTGGTIDKLECVPGLKTELAPERFVAQVTEIGVAICAQSARIAPADRKIYALRNETATVESIPLIASSVMSKKLAVGADAIVLDVKAGRGAFVPSVAEARKLATAMVEIGSGAGRKVVALVTRMDEPLGRAVGDAVELVEAIETLRGRGPRDFVNLCTLVAGHMLALGGVTADAGEGRKAARRALRSGVGLAKLRELVVAQGGDPSVIDEPSLLTKGAAFLPVSLDASGYVNSIDARRIGEMVRELKSAAGERKSLCGVLVEKKVGDRIGAGEVVAAVVVPDTVPAEDVERAKGEVSGAFRVSDAAPRRQRLLAAVVWGTAEGRSPQSREGRGERPEG
jgi:pyrimidine-nucleoside phosphorylase